MQGIGLFLHALRMVLANGGAALRLSGLLMAVQFAAILALGQQAFYLPIDPATGAPVGAGTQVPAMGGAVLAFLLQMGAGIWITVGWHRFILAGQPPGRLLPKVPMRAMLRYLGIGLLYALILLLAAIPLTVVAFFLAGPVAVVGQGGPGLWPLVLFGLLVWVPVGYLALRLAPILAAAALQTPLPLSEVWYRSGTHGGALLALTVTATLGYMLINMPVGFLALSFPGLAFGYGFLAQWVVLLVSASLVNTLYLHIIEDRPIYD